MKNIVSQNRKARHNYTIEDCFEAGVVLTGTEVKSLRSNKVSINDSHVGEIGGELFILNSYIPEYLKANRFNHFPRRPRKLLLHNREINKILGKIKTKGYTCVALSIFFNKRNKAKIEIALAKGKAQHDKRASIKEREWQRDKARITKIQ